MSDRVTAVWSEDYIAYDFGPAHPLKPVRVELTVELARACGLLDRPNVTVVPPRAATLTELQTVHDPAYIAAVERIGSNAPEPYADHGWGIGAGDNPAFPRMHEASTLVCGGGVVAAERVRRGEADHAWYPAGGLHHAMPARASGFCIYNDPAVAIRWLLDHGAQRVAYVDVDVHHGDGVQEIFYGDPRVLTISLHESGYYLFPGTGFVDETGTGDAEGTKVNLPLPPNTADDVYLEAFEQLVPPLVEAFKPDVLFTQLGCDTHVTDPLAHLALSTRAYRRMARAFHDLAHRTCEGRWVATGGGGYQVFDVVPRAWTLYFAELAGADAPDALPEEYLDAARARGARDLTATFDDPPVELSPAQQQRAREETQATVEQVRARLAPYFPTA